jgi:4-hydroxybenzoate polyprenyltransferase
MLAYLQLVRLPTVFTAMADIFLGFVLTHLFLIGPDGWNHPEKFFGLLASSCCLYLAGMVFNDVFDRAQDAKERPTRPIPSGRVSLRSAVILGTALMIAGLISAAFVTWISLQVAGLLVVAILAYDAVLKRTILGPVAMGTCRSLNLLLGASDQTQWIPPGLLDGLQILIAAGLGIYIVGVTVFARTEAHISSRRQLGLAQFLFSLGIVVLGIQIAKETAWSWPLSGDGPTALAMLAVVGFTLNRRAVAALIDPSPANVQLTVKSLLLSYVILDATMVFWRLNSMAGPYPAAHALATAALVIPALLLSRVIPMT